MRISILLLSIFVFAACSDEPTTGDNNTVFNPTNGKTNNNTTGTTNNGTSTNNNTTTTVGTTDTGGSYGDGCEDVVCEDIDQRCVRGSCISKAFKIACFNAQKLGVLDITQAKSITGDTAGFADSLSFDCSEPREGFSGPENAIQFELSADANVKISLSSAAAIDWVMDLRDDCNEASSSILCRDPETLTFSGKAGQTYTILVEPLFGIDEGEFKLDFEFTTTLCAVPGEYSCQGEDLTRCVAGGAEIETYSCPAGCTGAACNGDTCADAIVVTAPATFTGDTKGLTSALNFASQPSCSPEGIMGINSPGSEIVLSFPGLTAGQRVLVDTSMNDQNDNAIFVLDNCSDQNGCIAGVDLGEKLDWTVPTSGDYFIVIDKITSNAKSFNYVVDIQ